jgi:methyl-accepting chemotaxis protein
MDLLAPAVAAMSRLRFTRQFALVAAVIAVPIAIMGTVLYRESERDIGLVARERVGLVALAPATRLLHAAHAHAMAANDIVGGDAASSFAQPQAQDRRALEAAAAQVDAAMAALREAHEANGHILGTQQLAAAVAERWVRLKAEVVGMTPDQSLDAHRAFSEQVLELMAVTGERSQLLVDPQMASAFLQDATVRRLPELLASFGQARSIMHAGKRDASALAMEYEVAMKNFAAARRDFTNAFGTESGDDAFDRMRSVFGDTALALLEKISARVKVLTGGAVSPPDEVRLASAAVDATYAAETAALELLDRTIAARARADRGMQVALLAALLASLGLAAYMLAGFFGALRRAMNEAMDLADHVSHGDLSRRIAASRNEMGDVVASLNRMSDRMSGLVADVKRSIAAVTSSARQVSRANADLSSRTDRQAASLETMAASTEELSAAVSGSAQHIEKAGRLVTGAAQAVEVSDAAMGRAVASMQAAGEVSRRIADITGVIDGIAFQTNILALNAAVEAARVGAEGRGFAVVAGEIRSLAQRAADSSREIRGLIEEAVGTIDAGGGLVGEAGQGLADTTRSMREAVEMMREVTAMAREQSASLEQINAAVAEMNGVTQENAAFVQQTARIAAEQERGTRELAATVESFRIEERTGAGVSLEPAREIRPGAAPALAAS